MEMDTSEIQEVPLDSEHSHSPKSFHILLGSPELLNSPALSISIANNDEHDKDKMLLFMGIFLSYSSAISNTLFSLFLGCFVVCHLSINTSIKPMLRIVQ